MEGIFGVSIKYVGVEIKNSYRLFLQLMIQLVMMIVVYDFNGMGNVGWDGWYIKEFIGLYFN